MWPIYRHYKGNYYLTIGSPIHSESHESHEVYRTLYSNPVASCWVRPTQMFFEKHEQAASRFTLVGRVRRAYPEDMREILSFGHEAWGKDKSLDEFLEAAQANSDTRRGERYLFENAEGVSCSGLNTLRFQRGLVGFASLATKQEERGKGYALLLMRAAMELLSCEAPNGRFLLYSEIAPTAYERLGFRILPEELQYFKPAVAMATGDTELTPEERQFLRRYF